MIRSVFISDTHMGGRASQIKSLISFLTTLKEQKPSKIYIVGDFIDGWKLRRNWYWNDDCSLVLRKILGFVKRGTDVYYLPGNHDDFLRPFIPDIGEISMGHFHVCDEIIHLSPDGTKNLVVHGDQFDLAIKYAPWLCHVGDVGYETLLRINGAVNDVRRWMGLHYWSLSKAVKNKVKQATNYISRFEEVLADYTLSKGCTSVICGHIHTPVIKKIRGVNYHNCGDWVENCTALIEKEDGFIELYEHE